MADVMTSLQRSKLMSRIKGKNTKPELKLRKALWAAGKRYRLHYRIGKIKPDIVFLKSHVAIFIDGCFWHCCPTHGVLPKTNPLFWKTKLDKNVERDTNANKQLEASGWLVIRIWEHEVEESVSNCVFRIEQALQNSISIPKELGS